jgi:hypothetical protein
MRDALIATGVVAPDPVNQGVVVVVGAGNLEVTQLSDSLRLPAPLDIVDSKENASHTVHITSTNTLPTDHEPL